MTDTGVKLEGFFRENYGRVLASLTRYLGGANMDLAEDSVQEAMIRAMRVWPLRGPPRDPAAWLYTAARNHALDVCRRDARYRELLTRVVHESEDHVMPAEISESELDDDRLAMIFLCCHPELESSARTALTLRSVCGLGTREIARAFLSKEAAVAQRIVRAKNKIAAAKLNLGMPPAEELPERLTAVLDVLYLVFNEGYSHREATGPRPALTDEALRLINILRAHPAGNRPDAAALHALMLLQSSRLKARLDDSGVPVPLEEQDRSLWDPARVNAGLTLMLEAGRGRLMSEYHLLAGIAACHATSRSHASTDWARIASLYELLLRERPAFTVRVNHAVAVSMRDGPDAGLALLESLEAGNEPGNRTGKEVGNDHLLPAARGEMLRRANRPAQAAGEYARAARLAPDEGERRLFERRVRQCES